MKNYLLILCGPLCSGKTTVVDLMLQSEPGLIRLSRDKIKRFISDYGGTNTYKDFLDDVMRTLIEKSLINGLNVVIEGNVALREVFQEIADKHKVRFVQINLEAPLDILTDRFHKRLADARARNAKMFCTDEAKMLDRYQLYKKMKDPVAPTIMTNTMTPSEIRDEIIKIINYESAKNRN